MPRTLLLAASLALLTILLSALGALQLHEIPSEILLGKQPDIALEHTGATGLSLQIVAKGAQSLITIRQDAKSAVKLSVPEYWERGEVQGLQLADITEEQSEFGFRRFTMARAGSITFSTPTPDAVTIHHTSKSPLKIAVTVVDLLTGQRTSDVRLLQEEKLTIILSDLKYSLPHAPPLSALPRAPDTTP